ncbi:hypothetical protein L484_000888 [Morus notabilis]|uniref:Auxin-induced protein 15A n=1 Tax=Morus notabilis TaxID=981085 RepID=W9QIM9_9ROSA|nr:auxin-responsive protein SAUR21 [Morus notabilis]EXB22713.1 hypothetical protein L484_000888 [Morus notabilis]
MRIRLPEMVLQAKKIIHRHRRYHHLSSAHNQVVPKGHFAVYVSEDPAEKKRFVVPISYLKHPLFQELLFKAAEEFGFDHQMGAITIPCAEKDFINLTSCLKYCS